MHETGCCIISLDDEVGPGTHWVASDIKGEKIFFFDSFSLPPPMEFVSHAKKIGKKIVFHAGRPLQKLESVKCGWFCLIFLNEIWKISFFEVLNLFSLDDPEVNEKFVKDYFKKL